MNNKETIETQVKINKKEGSIKRTQTEKHKR